MDGAAHVRQTLATRATAVGSAVPPPPERPSAWPRLMSLELAAVYVGLSPAMLREYINDGSLRVTRPIRPQTHRAYGIRAGRRTRRAVASDVVRRLLVDIRDLDRLVDQWRQDFQG
jgi:hypothetical protein